jgi:[ribosomal protein S5]-alanine N-acetyltransferase
MLHRPTLRDGELCLAPLEVADVSERYVGWLNDPQTVGQTEQSGLTHTGASVRAYVEAALRAPDALIWRILLGDDHVGNVRLSGIQETHRRASIGLIIGDAGVRGHGVGTRVIRLVARYAIDDLHLNKVTAGIYATNTASRRAFEKAGFQLEAVLRRHAWHEGRFIDVFQFAHFSSDQADRAR